MDNFYEEYQWSPSNINGNKYYTREQLLALRNVSTITDCKSKLSCLNKVNLMPTFAQNYQFPTSVMCQPQNQRVYRRMNTNGQQQKTSESNRKSKF